jgi:hypothetical protein
MSNTTSVSSAIVDPFNPFKYIVMQICTIFTLTHLLLNRNLRSTLHNHTSLILLIISTFDSLLSHPLTLNYSILIVDEYCSIIFIFPLRLFYIQLWLTSWLFFSIHVEISLIWCRFFVDSHAH